MPNYAINTAKGPAQLIWNGDPENPSPFTLANISTVISTNIWVGDNPAVGPLNPANSTEISEGGYVSLDGSAYNYYVLADGPGGLIQIIPGVTSFFLPVSLSALGGAAVYVQSATPPTTGVPTNSLWFNTSNGSMNVFNGTSWVAQQFSGSQLIQATSILAAQIGNGTLTTTQLAAAAGILGTQIASGTITGGNIAANTITASNIAANTITAAQLAAGIIYAGIVNGTTIDGGTFIAGTSPNPQVQISEVSNAGLIQFLSNIGFSGFQDANIECIVEPAAPNKWVQLAIVGPVQASAEGVTDWVEFQLNCSSGSGIFSSGQLNYFDSGGTQHIVATYNNTGFTSLVGSGLVAQHPGATVPTAETWQTITLDSGWSNAGGGWPNCQYRMLPEGMVQLIGSCTHAAYTAATNVNGSNPLPTAYRPSSTHRISDGYGSIGGRSRLEMRSTGILVAVGASVTGVSFTTVDLDGIYPLI